MSDEDNNNKKSPFGVVDGGKQEGEAAEKKTEMKTIIDRVQVERKNGQIDVYEKPFNAYPSPQLGMYMVCPTKQQLVNYNYDDFSTVTIDVHEEEVEVEETEETTVH